MTFSLNRSLLPACFGLLAAISCPAAVTSIDQGGTGYSQTGNWVNQSGTQGLNGDWRYQSDATTNETATYDFTSLPAGNYVASTTSFTQGNLSTDAQWALSDGAGTFSVNQRVKTTDFDNDAGTTFQRLSSSVGGEVTPFSITDGTFQGVLSDNDMGGSSFLIADALRLESVRADVMKIYTIDNGAPGYVESLGIWDGFSEAGDYGVDFRFSDQGPAEVTITFSGIDPGFYRVSTAWTGGANRPSAVTLGYSTTGAMDVTSAYSQVPGAAADDVFEEVNWQDMFNDVEVTDGELVLTLSKTGSGLLVADAFRLEMTAPVPEPSSLALLALASLGLVRRRR